jgi:hypothetical protein
MTKKRIDQAKIEELRALADRPEQQSRLAIDVLATESRLDLLLPALKAISANPTAEARPVLRRRYEHFDTDNGKRDQGCHIRARIVDALAKVANQEDITLFERAALTYEYLPPGPTEVAAGLRAAGLVAMATVDPELAAYHAGRLLQDPLNAEMSGEPAVTAARVLGMQGGTVSLYQYVASDHLAPEVAAESLSHMSRLPDSLVSGLVDKFHEHESPVIRIGLVDLLVSHQADPNALVMLRKVIDEDEDIEVFHYAAAALAASRNEELIETLVEIAEAEHDTDRLISLEDALVLLPSDAQAAAALERVRGILETRGR